MTSETSDDDLRAMALNRGLRLVKSRRRKPGSGDFGKFGLTDSAGKRLFGFGPDGLQADADAIEAYLRKGSVDTWQRSADSASANAPSAGRATEAQKDAAPASRPRPKARSETPRRPVDAVPMEKSKPVRKAAAESEPEPEPKPAPRPKAAPEPRRTELVVRAGKPADDSRILALLAQLGGTAAGNPAAFRKTGGTILVAELDDLVGCAAFSVLPTLQHGPIGRISVVLVDDRHRRRGIGSRLLDAASEALVRRKCNMVEMMSDIEIRNAHGFLRACGFRQTSYRFARDIGSGAE